MLYIEPKPQTQTLKCTKCGGHYSLEKFIKTRSFFYPTGYLPTCGSCIEDYLVKHNFAWDKVDKLCQYADLPFIPKEFERLRSINGTQVFSFYSQLFFGEEYEGLGWKKYHDEFLRLKEQQLIDDELPEIREAKFNKLRERWGPNYDEEALLYLEKLFQGLLLTQNVSSMLQSDQALKICKISYELDSRIRSGTEFDKLLTSYDKLVKTAEFTPKNVKSANDFDSIGELVHWLEKRGWKNEYYNNVPKDVVDETIANIQNFNRRLYINETSIGEEISRRIEALKTAEKLSTVSFIDENAEIDFDNYDNEGFEKLFDVLGDNEEFDSELEGDDDG